MERRFAYTRMLPLTNNDFPQHTTTTPHAIKTWIRLIFSDSNSVNLLLFLLLNLSFAFVELLYGIWTNSLGLISDAFHMFFDCTGLCAGLAASVITKWKATESYSFGYVRAEVLSGFVNGLFLLFIAFFIMSEAVERAIEPPEVKHERLFHISVLGLLVNLVGLYVFHHGHSHGHHCVHHKHLEEGSQSGSLITKGVFLHILADTLGSIGVIGSSLLMRYFGWMRADPICSMIISVLIIMSVFPLIKDSVQILMQRQPAALDDLLPDCFQKVRRMSGVYSIQEPHFWTLCNGYFVGGIKIHISKEADVMETIRHVQMIFASVGIRQMYVQTEYA